MDVLSPSPCAASPVAPVVAELPVGTVVPTTTLPRCGTCAVTFPDVESFRAHARSEWHVANLRRVVAGKAPLAHGDSKEDDDAIFATASSAPDVEAGEEDAAVSTSSASSEDEAITAATNSPNPIIRCPQLARKLQLWRSALPVDAATKFGIGPDARGCAEVTVDASTLSQATAMIPTETKWLVLLFRSGHFAAAVFRHCGKDRSRPAIIVHKTFHRYTVRRKQGGDQSTRDNSGGGKPRSAGAAIRRHNVTELRREIHTLLASWAPHLEACQRLFVSATKRTITSLYCDALTKDDPRLHRVPFVTRRPTLEEAKNVFGKLSSVSLSSLSVPTATVGAVPGTTMAGGGEGAAAPAPAPPAPAVPTHTVAADVVRPADAAHFGLTPGSHEDFGTEGTWVNELCRACENGRAEHAKLMLHEVEPNPALIAATNPALLGINLARLSDGFTPLHCAAANNDVDLVLALMERGADPTKRDFRRRLPHMVAPSRDVLAAIVVYYQANPSTWPYRVNGVIPGLRKDKTARRKKKKGGKAAQAEPVTTSPRRRRRKSNQKGGRGADDDDELAMLDAAVAAVSEARAEASARTMELNSQRDLATTAASMASRLGVDEVALLAALSTDGDMAEGLQAVSMALSAGMSPADVRASIGLDGGALLPPALPPALPLAASGAASAPTTAVAPVASPPRAASPPPPPAPRPCAVCEASIEPGAGMEDGADVVCGAPCRRRLRATRMADAAARRMATPE